MYIYTCTSLTYACGYIYIEKYITPISIYLYTCPCIYIQHIHDLYIHKYVCVHTYGYVYIYIFNICMWIYIEKYITPISIYTCPCIYIEHTCMQMYMHIISFHLPHFGGGHQAARNMRKKGERIMRLQSPPAQKLCLKYRRIGTSIIPQW